MSTWKIAGVQMDCRIGDKPANLAAIRSRLRQAAGQGAQLVVFPECALTGYCFDSKAEAWSLGESVPGPSTAAVAEECGQLGVFAAFGMLETAGAALFNACALVGPQGLVANYRKVHLPFLGVDRFTTPGDRPFAVHELAPSPPPLSRQGRGESLRVGMTICYDGSFPEAARVLMLQGADLVVLPTNWPPGALTTVQYLIPARALENHIYFAAVNRVGEERGFRFIGQSRILDPGAHALASGGDGEEVLYADIDPAKARNKHLARIPGKYELHRLNDRRPEMYGEIVRPKNE